MNNWQIVNKYIKDILSGKKTACEEIKQACLRFKQDIESKKWDIKKDKAEFCIDLIEHTLVHQQGETLKGEPLRGTPFLLEPWQKFIIYNLTAFYVKGTDERRFKEAFIYIPRKNGKTSFMGALAWSLAILSRKSGSKIYITSAALKQSLESWNFIKNSKAPTSKVVSTYYNPQWEYKLPLRIELR